MAAQVVAPLEAGAAVGTPALVGQAQDISLLSWPPPTDVGRFEPRARTSFHFRGVTLHPPDRDVIGAQAPLGEQLLHVR